MSVEFIGMIFHRSGPDLTAFGGDVRPAHRTRLRAPRAGRGRRVRSRTHRDRVRSAPEGSQVAAYAAAHTERLSAFLVSAPPGLPSRRRSPRAALAATRPLFAGTRTAVAHRSPAAATQSSGATAVSSEGRAIRPDRRIPPRSCARRGSAGRAFRSRPSGTAYQLRGLRRVPSGRIEAAASPSRLGGSSEAAYRIGAKHVRTSTPCWG